MASTPPVGRLDPCQRQIWETCPSEMLSGNPLRLLSSQKRIDFCILEGVRLPNITQMSNSTGYWCARLLATDANSMRLDRHT